MIDYSVKKEEPYLLMDREVIKDYAEFSGESIIDVVMNIQNFVDLGHEGFNESVQSSGGDVWEAQKNFYENNQDYIYDLLGANGTRVGIAGKLNNFIPNIMTKMKNHGGSNTFLDFGAGCGVLCQMMVEWGNKEATYMDIQSPMAEFAQWRYDKYGLTNDIETVIISQDDFTLDRKYSIIFTDAVWEHLPEEKQEAYAEKLAQGVEDGGMLVFIVDVDGVREDRPMHYHVDMDRMFDIFKECGLSETFVHPYKGFASVWERK